MFSSSSVSQGSRNKSKSKQTGPNQTYKLLQRKGNHIKTKRQPTEWQKIFANDETMKGLISKIYIQLIQLNNKTPPPSISGRRLKEISLQRENTDGQKAQEKMLNTTNY